MLQLNKIVRSQAHSTMSKVAAQAFRFTLNTPPPSNASLSLAGSANTASQGIHQLYHPIFKDFIEKSEAIEKENKDILNKIL